MKKIAFVTLLVISMALTAEAARKGSSKKQPVDSRENTEPCAAYECTDERETEGSDDTYVSSSETYEGNDRDSGSEYINGMPY